MEVQAQPHGASATTDAGSGDRLAPPEALLPRTLEEARLCTERREGEKAVYLWVKSASLARIAYGDSHFEFARCHIELARTYLNLRGLLQQALNHAVKGRDILLSSPPPPPPPDVSTTASLPHNCPSDDNSMTALHFYLTLAHCVIGRVYTAQGRLKEAESALLMAEKASDAFSKTHPAPGPGGSVDVQLDLEISTAFGKLCTKQKRFDLAKKFFEKALDIHKSAFKEKEHGGLTLLLKELALVNYRSGNTENAFQLLDEANRTAVLSFGEESEQVAELCVTAASIHSAEKNWEKVESLLQNACSIYSDEDDKKVTSCKEDLAHTLVTLKKHKEAISLMKEVVSSKKAIFGDGSEQVAYSLKFLGTIHLSEENVESARKYLTRAKDMYCAACGSKHKEVTELQRMLSFITSESSDASTEKPRFRTTFKT